jgi:hypothetical protein
MVKIRFLQISFQKIHSFLKKFKEDFFKRNVNNQTLDNLISINSAKSNLPEELVLIGESRSIDIWLFAPMITDHEFEDLNHRLDFYVLGKRNLHLLTEDRFREPFFDSNPVLVFCQSEIVPEELKGLGGRLFNIDHRYNREGGYEWARLTRYLTGDSDINSAFSRLKSFLQELRAKQLKKSYIFGTGPSLEKAIERDWSDGFCIVCNTIVRDPVLWKHLKPDFIVAGDSRYHFGYTSFSRSFQKDLLDRLQESKTFFLYPEIFDSIAQREFFAVRERLLPVPYGYQKRVDIDLSIDYELPSLGNVLPLLLLPLACTLSKDVYLWGFDGRAPNDALFWSNSSRHNYPEKMPELLRAHPAFFESYMPKKGSNSYVNTYMGDELDKLMEQAESRGYNFFMMHPTWTATLQKRIKDPAIPRIPYLNG